jgi:hypothetical protein
MATLSYSSVHPADEPADMQNLSHCRWIRPMALVDRVIVVTLSGERHAISASMSSRAH